MLVKSKGQPIKMYAPPLPYISISVKPPTKIFQFFLQYTCTVMHCSAHTPMRYYNSYNSQPLIIHS